MNVLGRSGAEARPRADCASDAVVFAGRSQAFFPFVRAFDEVGHHCVDGMAFMVNLN